jgi:hypothetical protein
LALTGCNAAKTAIEQKAGNALGNAVGQVQNVANNLQNAPAQGNVPSEAAPAPVDNGNSGSTDADKCMQGCGMLSGTGMFSKTFCQDSCWAAKAKETGDASICDSKVDQTNSLVLFACYMNVAEKNKDAKYCDKIGKDSSDAMRGGCYGDVAKVMKDPSVCDPIKGNMMYDPCVSDAKGQ